ncbi:hypothetical protein [Streptomyces vinaceus]
MGAVGSSADNAAAESFNAAFKRECRRTRERGPGKISVKLGCATVRP